MTSSGFFKRAPGSDRADHSALLLPPVLPSWPGTLMRGDDGPARKTAAADAALLMRIRAETLFWPAVRARSRKGKALALDAAALQRALGFYAEADVLLGGDLSMVDPDGLEAVFGPPGPVTAWALLGGLAVEHDDGGDESAAALLAAGRGVCPWTGAAISTKDAVEAQTLLRRSAMAARGPVRLVEMSRWKRRNLIPFLTGPDGPPIHGRPGGRADPCTEGTTAVWGAAAAPGALRVEDGFLRSVGLGLRHTPPLSLTIDALPPYFDATGPNAFDETVRTADFTPDLLARGVALRHRVVALGLTKYNLTGGDALPDPAGREALLVPGQVSGDASIRLGARAVRDDLALLRAARALNPEAFILYKPHPDVATGMRKGAAPMEEVRRLADAVVVRADAAACLAWADSVATITSLMGFEALLRGKAVACFGRPFYSGWGLTLDLDPPPRSRRLTLDQLTAAALILYPRYVDPRTRLPCPPEIALTALARQRAHADHPAARAVRLWRDAVSWLANRPLRGGRKLP
jgi:hypothetical protein